MAIQLVDVRQGVAVVRQDEQPAVEMSWGLLHEAQDQDGPAGLVYRWLMVEFVRCEYEQRQGRAWRSPAREVGEIVRDLRARDAREAAAVETARREREGRQAAEAARRERGREAARVEAERCRTAANDPWWPIPSWEVPERVRFDVPRRNQGQIVEVSYGTFGRAEADGNGPYMSVTDHGNGERRTYRRK
jgi:hypothetical protein